MHDIAATHWHEPKGLRPAGNREWKRPNSPYDTFMEREGVPVFRGIGFKRVQDLPLQAWNRMGGRGSFIQLYGTEGLWGCYTIEVPGRGALHPERHMYEEVFLVIDGRGTTEIWIDGQDKPRRFEWQKGSLFSVPLNTWHRIVNASSAPAQMLVGTTAPNVINLFRDTSWVFNSTSVFPSRYDGSEDYFKARDDIAPSAGRGLAARTTNLIPDVTSAELYLDNRRSPGYKRVEADMAKNAFYQFLAEYRTGQYSRVRAGASAAALICIRGTGYTYTWPRSAGPAPWRDGKAHLVKRQDYEPGGMVSAAPYGGDWFHAHFGTSKEPLRLLCWYGPNNHPAQKPGRPGESLTDGSVTDIPYWDEDPFIRQEYDSILKANGVPSRMDAALYQKPAM